MLIESADSIGGRVQTENVNGFLLDVGFQVMIAGYPVFEDSEEVDLRRLKPGSFASGAKIYYKHVVYTIADPFRHPQRIFSTQLAPFVKAKDALLLWKLRKTLKSISPQAVFEKFSNIKTIDFLKDFGFSAEFINAFLLPFYSGIFLESSLSTPAPMFCFVFKMLSDNKAVLPYAGIGQITTEIARNLDKPSIRTGQKVTKVNDNQVVLESGETIDASQVIITSAPLLNELYPTTMKVDFHQTVNLYFELSERLSIGKYIGLNPDKTMLVNSFCMPTAIQSSYAPAGKHLLSVTLNPQVQWSDDLPEKVMIEIDALTKKQNKAVFLKHYQVKQALPQLSHLSYEPKVLRPDSHVLAAGDFTANASVNAAILAGRALANAVGQTQN